ncbi:MAG: trypsin-like peptidase domain-containing protein [Actinobacteria bacterium]|nr:trypsin-like peptidase domain-containing protein [Actinomycetota bacterium]
MSIKSPFKNRNYPFLILLAIIIALFISILITISVIGTDISSQIKKLSGDMKNTYSTFSTFNENFKDRINKLSSAEFLLNNTNLILKTVYFGTADNEEREEAKDFTAFSMIYKDKFYIITAGHCVEMDDIKYKNFKFRSNFKFNWFHPDLITYKNDYSSNNDYAIFYDRNVNIGLIPAEPYEDLTPQYVIGNIDRNLNIIKRYKDAKEGESGSPILNSRCHVVGIMIKKGGGYTPIDAVLEALENVSLQ